MLRKRRASSDDRQIKRLIYRELLPQTMRVFPDFIMKRSEIRDRLKQGITYVVGKKEVPPLGFITVQVKGDMLYIDMLAVRRASHGKGWGSALMAKAEQYGRSRGCTHAMLYVEHMNSNAIQFYKSRGYSQMNYVPDIRCFKLSKSLE